MVWRKSRRCIVHSNICQITGICESKRFDRNVIILMKSISLFLALALLGCSMHLQANMPKLPLYIGEGYNIFKGNPLTNTIDPGFTMPIFAFTYGKGEKTEDGTFRIPDYTLSRQLSSCSYDAQINSFKGGHEYQQQLKKIVQVEGGYRGLVGKASFSLSTNFQKIESSTHNQQSVVTQAYSECQAYKIFIDSPKKLTLREDFIEKVKYSNANNDWNNFFDRFGTHYVTEATMGGRATQEMSFSYDSVSKLKKKGITIDAAAEAEYYGFFVGKKNQNADKSKILSFAETMRKEKHEFYIGGKPPSEGNVRGWMAQVHQAPMPIKYMLKEISNLFKFIPSFDSNIATANFNEALKNNCEKDKNCREPKPDYIPPPPPKPSCDLKWYGPVGSQRGQPFSFTASHPQFMQLKKAVIRSGALIDSVKFIFGGFSPEGKYIEESSPAFGGNGGQQFSWQIPSGKKIKRLWVLAKDYVQGIQISFGGFFNYANFGNIPMISSIGGMDIELAPNQKIVGIVGESGKYLAQFGFQTCTRVKR